MRAPRAGAPALGKATLRLLSVVCAVAAYFPIGAFINSMCGLSPVSPALAAAVALFAFLGFAASRRIGRGLASYGLLLAAYLLSAVPAALWALAASAAVGGPYPYVSAAFLAAIYCLSATCANKPYLSLVSFNMAAPAIIVGAMITAASYYIGNLGEFLSVQIPCLCVYLTIWAILRNQAAVEAIMTSKGVVQTISLRQVMRYNASVFALLLAVVPASFLVVRVALPLASQALDAIGGAVFTFRDKEDPYEEIILPPSIDINVIYGGDGPSSQAEVDAGGADGSDVDPDDGPDEGDEEWGGGPVRGADPSGLPVVRYVILGLSFALAMFAVISAVRSRGRIISGIASMALAMAAFLRKLFRGIAVYLRTPFKRGYVVDTEDYKDVVDYEAGRKGGRHRSYRLMRPEAAAGGVMGLRRSYRELIVRLNGGGARVGRTDTAGQAVPKAVAVGADREEMERVTRAYERVRYGDADIGDAEAAEYAGRCARAYGPAGAKPAVTPARGRRGDAGRAYID